MRGFLTAGSLLFSMAVSAQVKFEHSLSWEQLKNHAKNENKYIFVDVVATWCGPCKKMDQEVYPNAELGSAMNAKFISVQLQTDSTDQDNEHVKAWRPTARSFLKDYSIMSFPTFLFFNPKGELIHQSSAYLDAKAFMELSEKAIGLHKQFLQAFKEYNNGGRDYIKVPFLLERLATTHQQATADMVAEDYFTHYLKKLPERELLTPDNLNLMSAHLGSSSISRFFYMQSAAIDSVLHQPGFSQGLIDNLIMKKMIQPAMNSKKEPNWDQLYRAIATKYSTNYAQRNILLGKISNQSWYREHQQWLSLANAVIDYYQFSGVPTEGFSAITLNSVIWNDIFLKVTDTSVLNKAIGLMSKVVNAGLQGGSVTVWNSHFMDTYANLLYKVGHAEDAIGWEEKAIELDNDPKSKTIQEKKETLEKMKLGQPTWGRI